MDPKLKRRLGRVPTWWADAKLGIFVHWTPASVPGFAPTDQDIGQLLMSGDPQAQAMSPYAEWYENSLRFPESPVARFHREYYGDRPYERFADDFVAGLDRWDPQAWARSFAATGARYVVLVAKHHDGWCLWPSEVANPNRRGWYSERDLVGELSEAVRAEGMRFGLYYSGGLDWTFDSRPIGTIGELFAAVPGGAYPDYAEAQVRELIERYRPSVLWNDIAWPTDQKRLNALFLHYFERVPDGVVNDRWMAQQPGVSSLLRYKVARSAVDKVALRTMRRAGGLVPPKPRFYQYSTPEFLVFDEIDHEPWEMVRGMDQGFGYNHTSTEADFLTRDDLLRTLVDITAKGGNLLLNVGPRGADAQIPDQQAVRLQWLSEWMNVNAAALANTRPWIRADDHTPEGHEVRYTALGDRVWALGWGDQPIQSLTLPVRSTSRTAVFSATGARLRFSETGAGLRIDLPEGDDSPVTTVAIDRAEAREPGQGTNR